MATPAVVKLDFPDRDLFILADGDWRGFRSAPCAKEPETVEWIRSFEPHSILWDVGASVGPYTLIASALGHQVEAFEPHPPSYGHLVQNAWLNELDVRAYPIALAATLGWGYFRCNPVPGSASHEGLGILTKAGPSQRDAIVYSDAVTRMRNEIGQPSHVKIDVDGAEMGVIEGGRGTWKHIKSMMIESEPPTIDDITVILSGAGLQLVDSWPRLGETKQRNYLFKRL